MARRVTLTDEEADLVERMAALYLTAQVTLLKTMSAALKEHGDRLLSGQVEDLAKTAARAVEEIRLVRAIADAMASADRA